VSAADLTLMVLGAVAVAASALWLRRSSADDPDGRKGVGVALVLGLAAIGGGAWRSLPEPPPPGPPASGPVVIDIGRDDDYRHGLPGGVFLAERTRHMSRNPMHGFMWSPNGSTVWEVGWIVRAPRAGRYELFVRYATDKRRPGEIWVNDRLVRKGLSRTTAQPLRPEWFREGPVELREGPNQLWFHSLWPLPSIDSLRLVELAPGRA
jgi:hypothetical protein